jgi:hypothetical protein
MLVEHFSACLREERPLLAIFFRPDLERTSSVVPNARSPVEACVVQAEAQLAAYAGELPNRTDAIIIMLSYG